MSSSADVDVVQKEVPESAPPETDGRSERPASTEGVHSLVGRVAALDGIRTIAVSLVFLFHLGIPIFSGGYLGVDVFFVLSGFLITTLLLQEIILHGKVDLPRFWARRMSRLIPAALLLLIVVGVWAAVLAPAYRRPALGADLLWSLFYVGNWHFITSTSYFAFDGTTSPLMHLWSLAVEEQFYVFWPLVLQLLAVLLASMSPGRHARRDLPGAQRASSVSVVAIAAVFAVLSASVMVYVFLRAGADRAYMGTDAKVFEPLIGALCAAALLRPAVNNFVTKHARKLMWAGLGGLVLAVCFLGGRHGPHPAYFFGGAVLTAAAVASLVVGASRVDQDSKLAKMFTNPVMTYLGRISYGIYLWHWPWTVWLLPHGTFDAQRALIVVAATLVSAMLSYHLVEMPLRSGRCREARSASVLSVGATAMAATCALPVILGGTPWYIGHGVVVASGSTKMMVVGDSVPMQLFGALAEAGEKRQVPVINGSHGGCGASGAITANPDGSPFNPGVAALGGDEDPTCVSVKDDQKQQLEKEKPTVVVWWSRYEYADFIGQDGKPLRAKDPGYREAQKAVLDSAVDRLTAGGATVVIVRPEPTGERTAQGCSPDQNDMEGLCAAFLVRLRFQDEVRRQWIDLLEEKVLYDTRLRMVSISDVFCRSDNNPCDDRLPLSSGGSFPPPEEAVARPDGSHFAAAARDRVADVLLERVMGSLPSRRES